MGEQLVQQTGQNTAATGTVTSNCTATTATQFKCTITYSKTGGAVNFQPIISVTPTLQNVGMALLDYSQVKVSTTGITILSGGGSSSGVTKPAWVSTGVWSAAGGHRAKTAASGFRRNC